MISMLILVPENHCKRSCSFYVGSFPLRYFYLLFCFVRVFLQSDENEDDNVDAQNGDHDSSNQKNKVNTECKGKTKNSLFNLTLVNSYGSTDMQALHDDGKILKLTG